MEPLSETSLFHLIQSYFVVLSCFPLPFFLHFFPMIKQFTLLSRFHASQTSKWIGPIATIIWLNICQHTNTGWMYLYLQLLQKNLLY